MDPPFLKMLQSIAEVEKDPRYATKCLDFDSLTLKYPDHVIVVASPTGGPAPPSPSAIAGQVRRLTTITAAFDWALKRAIEGGPKRWSILVYAGMYIDVTKMIMYEEWCVPEGFALEIVGVKDVRIVCREKHLIVIGPINLTLRNIGFYDRRVCPVNPALRIAGGARVNLVDVKAHVPHNIFVDVSAAVVFGVGEGTRASLTGCVVTKGRGGYLAADTGEIYLDHCHFSDLEEVGGCTKNSVVVAKNCKFTNSKKVTIIINSKGSFDQCEFEDGWTEAIMSQTESSHSYNGFFISGGADVSIERSSFRGYMAAIFIYGTGSKVEAKRCRVTQTAFALSVSLNASASFVNGTLGSRVSVAVLSKAVHGQVELKGNKMATRGERPRIVRDELSATNLRHDFRNAEIQVTDQLRSPTPSSKDQSKFTKKTIADLRNKGADIQGTDLDQRGHLLFKRCVRCLSVEDIGVGSVTRDGRRGPPVKFRYCKECKSHCYCSKECQVADWPDHKMDCIGPNPK